MLKHNEQRNKMANKYIMHDVILTLNELK